MAFPRPPFQSAVPPAVHPSFGLPSVPRGDPRGLIGIPPPNLPAVIPDPSFPAAPIGSKNVSEPEIIKYRTVTLRPPDDSVDEKMIAACFTVGAPIFARTFSDRKDVRNGNRISQALSLPAWNAWAKSDVGRAAFANVRTAVRIVQTWSYSGIQAANEEILRTPMRSSTNLQLRDKGPMEVANIWLGCERLPTPGCHLWLLLRRVRMEKDKHLEAELGVSGDFDTQKANAMLVEAADEDDDGGALFVWQWFPHVTQTRCVPHDSFFNDNSSDETRYAGWAIRVGMVDSVYIPDDPLELSELQTRARRVVSPPYFKADIPREYRSLPFIKVHTST